MTHVLVSVQKHRLALLALGSNSPAGSVSTDAIIRSSIGDIFQDVGAIVSASRFYRTPAYPAGSGPDFVNAALAVRTPLSAEACLEALHRIEARHARERRKRWGERTLDIDLLAFGDEVAPDRMTQDAWRHLPPERQAEEAPDRLILPHPRLQDRAFVLIPLAEIAPGWRHPVTGRSVIEMLDALPDADKAAICPV